MCVLPHFQPLYECVCVCVSCLVSSLYFSVCVSCHVSSLYLNVCVLPCFQPSQNLEKTLSYVCVCAHLALPLFMCVSCLISNLPKTWNKTCCPISNLPKTCYPIFSLPKTCCVLPCFQNCCLLILLLQ